MNLACHVLGCIKWKTISDEVELYLPCHDGIIVFMCITSNCLWRLLVFMGCPGNLWMEEGGIDDVLVAHHQQAAVFKN